jgi:hypothetical protein
MNIFTKEISHTKKDSTRPCFTILKNKVVNDSFCKLKILALNVCGLVSKLRNPDFREFISLYGIICLTETACKPLQIRFFYNNNLSSIVNQKTQ